MVVGIDEGENDGQFTAGVDKVRCRNLLPSRESSYCVQHRGTGHILSSQEV